MYVLEYHAVDTRVPFVGRSQDVRELLAFLKRGGALTLVGAGGVGKTRLAHEAIARFTGEHAVECTSVSLAGIAPESVVGTVMSALGLTEETGRTPYQTIAGRLADRAMIVALDNCEHAPDETGALIEALRALPGLSVLATSQRRLDYMDETVFEVGPFTAEDGVAFFIARAGINAARIDESMLATVSAIVERVDGLAVALDLAAARLASLSLTGLAAELDELRPYQLRSTRGSEPRHRTIGNVIAWTHSQLSDAAKRAFAQASLFADEFDEDDLVSLQDLSRNDARAAIHELVVNSLAVKTKFGFRMLLPIRAVATRMLAALRNRRALDEAFAARMNALALEMREQMHDPQRASSAVQRLHVRYADFCAALGWALKRPHERVELVADIPTAMMTIWAEGGRYAEGLRWTERLEAIAQRLNPALRGRLHYLGLCVAHAAAEYHRMVEKGPQTVSAFTIAGDRLGLARAYNALAAASLNTGRLDDATTYVETALRFYEQLAHERGIATALINQGSIFFEGLSDPIRAQGAFRKAVALLEGGGLDVLAGTAIGDLAEVEYALGDYDAASAHARAAASQFEGGANPPMIAWQYQTLARCAMAQGALAVASEQLLVACDLLRRSAQPMYIARLTELAGRRMLLGGNPRAAALLLAAARRFRGDRSLIHIGPFAREVADDEAALLDRYGKEPAAGAAKTVATWDLSRLCSTVGDLLVAG